MQTIRSSYQRLADGGAHATLLLVSIFAILVVPAGGVIASTLTILIALLGIATLTLDQRASSALASQPVLRATGLLLGAALLWQALGVAFRDPPDRRAGEALVHALSVALLLPVVVAAMVRDRRLVHKILRALYAFGVCAALLSLARHAYLTASPEGALSVSSLLSQRLVPVGRASHAIFGAGGLAAGAFAGLALWPEMRRKALAALGLALIVLTIGLTQSRGPILSLALAGLAAGAVSVVSRERARWLAPLVALACFAFPVALVLGEPWLKSLLCNGEGGFCRPSARQDVWAASVNGIVERPWFGVGPGFRFAEGSVPHPHNGLLGLAFYFGWPVCALFLALAGLALKRAALVETGPARFFVLAGGFFSAGFLGTDLSNPFGTLNTHYLYLWLPLILGVCSGALALEPVRASADDGSVLRNDEPAFLTRRSARG